MKKSVKAKRIVMSLIGLWIVSWMFKEFKDGKKEVDSIDRLKGINNLRNYTKIRLDK